MGSCGAEAHEGLLEPGTLVGPVMRIYTNERDIVAKVPAQFVTDVEDSVKHVAVYKRENKIGADLAYALRPPA